MVHPRKLLLALGSAFAVALPLWWLQRERSRPVLRVLDGSTEARSLLLERRVHDAASSGLPRGRTVHGEIPPEDAARMYSMPSDVFVYNRFVAFRYRPSMRGYVDWAERDGGGFPKVTNSLGLREDGELPPDRDLLVLVTGDSHTDGLCANGESFANRLEAQLATHRPGRVVEVLNAGVSGYSFYNYLGSLEEFLHERPDAFVVAFYSGNDFLDMVKPRHYFERTAPPPRTQAYWERLQAAQAVSAQEVVIVLNQLLYFQAYPQEAEMALQAAIEVCSEIARSCAEHGIRLILVHIPPGYRVEGELDPALARARDRLELSKFDLGSFDRLADRFIGAAREQGIEVIDLREAFGAERERFYWSDRHINLQGHERIAELLFSWVETFWPRD